MVRIFSHYYPRRLFLMIALDGIIASACLLQLMRFHTPGSNLLPAEGAWVAATACLCLFVFYVFDFYDLDLRHGLKGLARTVFLTVGVATLAAAPLSAIALAPSRSATWLCAGFVGIVSFLLCLHLVYERYSHPASREKLLLIGDSPLIDEMARHVRTQRSLPVSITSVMRLSSPLRSTLGALERSFHPTWIAVDQPARFRPDLATQLIGLRQRGVRVEDATDVYEAITGRLPIRSLTEADVAHGPALNASGWVALATTAMDLIVASLMLMAAAPAILICMILIKLESRGPCLYRQERVGRDGRLFNIIKLRTMRIDAETSTGPIWACKDDPRVTRIGRSLRKYHLDELPQLWNVLRREMSMVGPRPERKHFTEVLRDQVPFYALRHTVTPGVTGWAQVCSRYGESIADAYTKHEYDLYYLKHRTLSFNLFILLKTVKMCLIGRGAQ
ncbi:sugar transferase [Terriglobus roseus]|uniref:Exopolysaccharide biosynthesis polyprenyl glycosylphosphotransferase n=1 Tax=Terriglobus roseus TaxID=392734 RepID=A0A1H4SJ15_9BACT|nr:sugar transferase [Terriglobus roseus]SEC44172.1 exopolysaccharide biosynthesis polyprenyl glycosylphosphotransferase [Terriglobus roseus]